MLLCLVTLLVASPDTPLYSSPAPSDTSFQRAAGAMPVDDGPDEFELPLLGAGAFVFFVLPIVTIVGKEENHRVLAGVGDVIFVPPRAH
jgi:hypothetical protein